MWQGVHISPYHRYVSLVKLSWSNQAHQDHSFVDTVSGFLDVLKSKMNLA